MSRLSPEQQIAVALDAPGVLSPAGAASCATNGAVTVPKERRKLVPISGRQLVEQNPHQRPAVINGLLRKGETMNIISASKIGKSWLGIDLVISIVTGGLWLGKFKCEPGKVLIIDNELFKETLADRIPRVGQAMRLEFDSYADGFDVIPLRGEGEDIDTLGVFFDSPAAVGYELILLDAWYRFQPPGINENDNAGVMQLYNTIDRYARITGASFVAVHHASKGSQSSKAVIDVGAGAGSQSRAADTHLVLRQHEEDGVVTLEAATRSWPPSAPICLRWDFPLWSPAPEFDPEKLRIDRPGRSKPSTPSNQPDEPRQVLTVDEFVARFIKQIPQTIEAIEEAVKSSGAGTKKAARSLVFEALQHQRIAKRAEGRGGRNMYFLPGDGTL